MRAISFFLTLLLATSTFAGPLKIEVKGRSFPLHVRIKNISPLPVSFRFIRIEMKSGDRWATIRESVNCECGKTCDPNGYDLSSWNTTHLQWDGLTSTCESVPADALIRVAIDNSCVVNRSELRTLGTSMSIKDMPGAPEPSPQPYLRPQPLRSCDLQMDVQGSPANTRIRRKITFRGLCQKMVIGTQELTGDCMDAAVITELADDTFSLLFFRNSDRSVYGLYGHTPENPKELPRSYIINKYSTSFGTLSDAKGTCNIKGSSLRTSNLSCSVIVNDMSTLEIQFESDKRTWPENDD